MYVYTCMYDIHVCMIYCRTVNDDKKRKCKKSNDREESIDNGVTRRVKRPREETKSSQI